MKSFICCSLNGFPTFLSAGKLVSTTPFVHASRINEDYVLMMGIEGVLHLQVQERNVSLHPRECLILPPGTFHRGLKPSKKLVFFWCHFSLNGRTEILTAEDAQKQYEKNTAEPPEAKDRILLLPMQFTPLCPERLSILLQQIQDVSLQKYRTAEVANSLLSALLFEMMEQSARGFYAEGPSGEAFRFNEICQWIRIHVYSSITVQDVAKHFQYNPNYISSVFHRKTGYSLGQYITHVKMYAAKELLLTTNKNVKEISLLLGYGDSRYFMRCFKKHENMTPTMYRNAYSSMAMNTRWLPRLEEEIL